MFIDSHAHYDDKAFDADRDAVLSSLPATGIKAVINAGADISSSEKSLELASHYAFVYAAVGIHPHEAARPSSDYLLKIETLSKNPKAVAIGEIGLDYHYDFSPRDIQKKVFDAQLSLAESLNLPVVVHEREAIADTLDIIRAHPNARGVMHCFSGSVEVAKSLINRGFLSLF
jgi:TatD DNase family protein